MRKIAEWYDLCSSFYDGTPGTAAGAFTADVDRGVSSAATSSCEGWATAAAACDGGSVPVSTADGFFFCLPMLRAHDRERALRGQRRFIGAEVAEPLGS